MVGVQCSGAHLDVAVDPNATMSRQLRNRNSASAHVACRLNSGDDTDLVTGLGLPASCLWEIDSPIMLKLYREIESESIEIDDQLFNDIIAGFAKADESSKAMHILATTGSRWSSTYRPNHDPSSEPSDSVVPAHPQPQPQQQLQQKPPQQPETSDEEEALKRNTDCVYFLASLSHAKRGSECEYRHSEYARVNHRDCWYWLNGSCLNLKYAFRHPPLDGLLGSPAAKFCWTFFASITSWGYAFNTGNSVENFKATGTSSSSLH
ncbi:hypothetical protein ACFX14_003131 [Malus domestica]